MKDIGLKPKEVREAIANAKEKYGLLYPLSVQGHKIYVDARHKVYIQAPQNHRVAELIGRDKDQVQLTEIVEPYLDFLEFDKEGMAARLIVYQEFFGATSKRIVMEPRTNFGEPTVEGTPYRVATLQRAVDAEGSIAAVARIYEVQEDEILLALHARTATEIKIAA